MAQRLKCCQIYYSTLRLALYGRFYRHVLSLGGTTGYAINPARDLGPRLMHALLPIPGKRDSDWACAWIPVLSPILGGLLAALAYDNLHAPPMPHPAL